MARGQKDKSVVVRSTCRGLEKGEEGEKAAAIRSVAERRHLQLGERTKREERDSTVLRAAFKKGRGNSTNTP